MHQPKNIFGKQEQAQEALGPEYGRFSTLGGESDYQPEDELPENIERHKAAEAENRLIGHSST